MSNRSNSPACTPPDAFWNTNKALAELIWGRHDGATVSTRVAEPIAALLDIQVGDAKALLHGAISVGAGLAVAKSNSGPLGLATAVALFIYLERDRCR